MTPLAIGLAGIAALLLAVAARVPVGVALAGTGFLGYAAIDGVSRAAAMAGAVPFELASAYSLSVVPLFLLMGTVAARAGLSRELFDAMNAAFAGFRGALASASVGACAAFGAICGSSIATAATFSRIAIPEMRRHGYEGAFAAGCVAAAGTLGILIPPSVILAVYAIAAEQSLARLFAAALVPGLVLAALYIAVVAVLARLHPHALPQSAAIAGRARLAASRGLAKMGLLFFLAVAGIYLGWFSPTEAAAVSALAAIAIGFASRTLGWRSLGEAFAETVQATAVLFFVVIGAFMFSRFVALSGLPGTLAHLVEHAALSPVLVLAAIALVYLLLGTFLEEVSTLLVTVPVLLPVVTGLGYDPVWFGVFVTVMATVGLVSPPLGLTVFVIQSHHPDIRAGRIYRATLPFVAADLTLVALLVAAPALALWLPARLGL
ncbi:MAG: TRAP transporter large permease [Burkholderiales bacterium]|nr:TRAP transporter large permease [Burkholderiales bacterium]